jgi:hypothetical protein
VPELFLDGSVMALLRTYRFEALTRERDEAIDTSTKSCLQLRRPAWNL